MLSLLALHRKAYPHKVIFTLKERVKTQTTCQIHAKTTTKFFCYFEIKSTCLRSCKFYKIRIS